MGSIPGITNMVTGFLLILEKISLMTATAIAAARLAKARLASA